jgi:hypothetical protein
MYDPVDQVLRILDQAVDISAQLPYADGIGWMEYMHNTKRHMFAAEVAAIKYELSRKRLRHAVERHPPVQQSPDQCHYTDLEQFISTGMDPTLETRVRWDALNRLKECAVQFARAFAS